MHAEATPKATPKVTPQAMQYLSGNRSHDRAWAWSWQIGTSLQLPRFFPSCMTLKSGVLDPSGSGMLASGP